MSLPRLTHLLSSALFCGLSVSAFAEDKLITQLKERLMKEKARQKAKAKDSADDQPKVPVTWEQFLAANQDKGVTRSELAKRFRVADANHDEILTPAEIDSHREAAARNKAKRKNVK